VCLLCVCVFLVCLCVCELVRKFAVYEGCLMFCETVGCVLSVCVCVSLSLCECECECLGICLALCLCVDESCNHSHGYKQMVYHC
jgi:hypothetical protein